MPACCHNKVMKEPQRHSNQIPGLSFKRKRHSRKLQFPINHSPIINVAYYQIVQKFSTFHRQKQIDWVKFTFILNDGTADSNSYKIQAASDGITAYLWRFCCHSWPSDARCWSCRRTQWHISWYYWLEGENRIDSGLCSILDWFAGEK